MTSSNWPYAVIRTARDDELIFELETRDAALVPVQRPDEFARRHVPDFDGSVAGRRDDVATIEVDDVDGGTVTHEDAPKVDFWRRLHVPDCDWTVLRNVEATNAFENWPDLKVSNWLFYDAQQLKVISPITRCGQFTIIPRTHND